MAVSHHLKPGLGERTRAKIMTVDIPNRRVEAVLKDGSMIQIAIWDVPHLFRWPIENEIWIVRRDNGIWMLDRRVQQGQVASTTQGHPAITVQPEPAPLETLKPGQAKIDASSVVNSLGQTLVAAALGGIQNGWTLVWNSATNQFVPAAPAPAPFLANLISNNLTSNNTTGWSASGFGALNSGATLTGVTSKSVIGTGCMQVTTTNTSISQGAATSVTGIFRAGVPYMISAYIAGNVGGEIIQLGAADNTAGDEQDTTVTLTNSFTRYFTRYVPNADHSNLYVLVKTHVASAYTFFMNAVQITLA